MSLVFDTTCRNCNAKTFHLSDYLSLRIGDEYVCIPHPCESENIKEHGVTLEEAAVAGRLRRNTAYACRECGKVSYSPELELPVGGTRGWVTMVVMALMFFVVYGAVLLLGLSEWWMLPAVILLGIGVAEVHRRLIRKRVLKAHGFPVDTRCQACESTDTVGVGAFILEEDGVMLCDECGAREQVCDEDGQWMS